MALPLLIRRPLPAALAAAITLVPELIPGTALACPYCAGRSQGSIWTNVVLAAFVFLPFLLSWAIYRIVRAHDDTPQLSPPPTSFRSVRSGERALESRRQAS